jgi:hypothetical protein
MNEIQFISIDGAPRFAVVPIELWDRLSALIEGVETTDSVTIAVRDKSALRNQSA